jgi:hypothetical protein
MSRPKLLPALRGLELVASGGVFDKDEIGGKNGEEDQQTVAMSRHTCFGALTELLFAAQIA